MTTLSIQDIESAINYWRQQEPSCPSTMVLCKPASALAEVYAVMIIEKRPTCALNTLSKPAQTAWQAFSNTEACSQPMAA